MTKYKYFQFTFIFLINFTFYRSIYTVNFNKIGVKKILFLNNNLDNYDLNIHYNLFDIRTSSTIPYNKSFTLKSENQLSFDVESLQKEFDATIGTINYDEDSEQLKRILGCIKNVEISNVVDGSKPKLCICLSSDQLLKVYVLNHEYQFDFFHIDFDLAIRSKECYADCVNNIEIKYPNGISSNGYRLTLESNVSPKQFVERMKFLNETYFTPNFNLANMIKPDLNTRIPKELFQIWIGKNPIPHQYLLYQKKWLIFCPMIGLISFIPMRMLKR